jgi:hypothetical protein
MLTPPPKGLHDWSGSLAQLAVYEKIRDGRQPKFEIRFVGDRRKRGWRCCESWGIENVLVDIPLPQSPLAPWDEVWSNLVAARNHFEQGGSGRRSSFILAVRQALKKWRDIKVPNIGSADPTKRS